MRAIRLHKPVSVFITGLFLFQLLAQGVVAQPSPASESELAVAPTMTLTPSSGMPETTVEMYTAGWDAVCPNPCGTGWSLQGESSNGQRTLLTSNVTQDAIVYIDSDGMAMSTWTTEATFTVPDTSAGTYRVILTHTSSIPDVASAPFTVITPVTPPKARPLNVTITPKTKSSAYWQSNDTVLKINVAHDGKPVRYALVSRIENGKQELIGETDANGELYASMDPGREPRPGTWSTEFFAYSPGLDASGSRTLEYVVSAHPNEHRKFVLDPKGWTFSKLVFDAKGMFPDLNNAPGGILDFVLPQAAVAKFLSKAWDILALTKMMSDATQTATGASYYPEAGDSVSQTIYNYRFKSGVATATTNLWRYELKIDRGGKKVYYESLYSPMITDLPPMMAPNWAAAGMYSPATLYMVDSLGRGTGVDPDTGQVINEIPNSYYTGPDSHPQIIVVFGPADGTLQVLAKGTGHGTIRLEYGGMTPDAIGFGESGVIDISPGQIVARELPRPGKDIDPPVEPPGDCDFYAETGHNLCGVFQSYWKSNGGLAVFGYPITEAFQEANWDTGETYIVQYFERERFEHRPENAGTPYEVLLGRLGNEVLLAHGRNWQDIEKSDPSEANYFAETGIAIAPEFIGYWSSHGLDFGANGYSFEESVALFGYPISQAKMETNLAGDTVLTQWFERARFEYHPDNEAEHRVLLGLLGVEILSDGEISNEGISDGGDVVAPPPSETPTPAPPPPPETPTPDPAPAAPTTFVASLSGSSTVPSVVTSATGNFALTLNGSGNQMSFVLSAMNIHEVTAAHIHLGRAGEAGPVVAILFQGDFSGDGTISEGPLTDADLLGELEGMTIADLVAEIEAGNTYVNVNTQVNSSGEIRGEITA